MARNVQSIHEFSHQASKWSLKKEYVVIRCDDSAVYEFARSEDGPPSFELARRFQPDGSFSISGRRLPASVEEACESLFGQKGSDWIL